MSIFKDEHPLIMVDIGFVYDNSVLRRFHKGNISVKKELYNQ